jgi:hypothetical protein
MKLNIIAVFTFINEECYIDDKRERFIQNFFNQGTHSTGDIAAVEISEQASKSNS